MKDLFRETVLGNVVRLLSGGKFFGYDEAGTVMTLKSYMVPTSERSSNSDIKGSPWDPENGKDARLVEWTLLPVLAWYGRPRISGNPDGSHCCYGPFLLLRLQTS